MGHPSDSAISRLKAVLPIPVGPIITISVFNIFSVLVMVKNKLSNFDLYFLLVLEFGRGSIGGYVTDDKIPKQQKDRV